VIVIVNVVIVNLISLCWLIVVVILGMLVFVSLFIVRKFFLTIISRRMCVIVSHGAGGFIFLGSLSIGVGLVGFVGFVTAIFVFVIFITSIFSISTILTASISNI